MAVCATSPWLCSAAAGIGDGGSSESIVPTSQAMRELARNSGAGGIAVRTEATPAAMKKPTSAVTANPSCQDHPRARQTAGVKATVASHALLRSAHAGGTYTSGRARLSAPKSDTTKKTYPIHGYGWTTA